MALNVKIETNGKGVDPLKIPMASLMLALVIICGCSRSSKYFNPIEIVGNGFSIEAAGVRRCATNATPTVFRSKFSGAFVGGDEHMAETFRPDSGGTYILIRSNDLHREYYSSTDGWGGRRMASVGHYPTRKNVSGVLIEGEFSCGGNKLSDPFGYRGFFFASDYGQSK